MIKYLACHSEFKSKEKAAADPARSHPLWSINRTLIADAVISARTTEIRVGSELHPLCIYLKCVISEHLF